MAATTTTTRRARPRNAHYSWTVPLGWLGLAAVIFGSWELLVDRGMVSAVYVSQPSAILKAIVSQITGPLVKTDAVATFSGVLIGWALASVLAVGTAFILSTSPYALRVIDPFFAALNSLPRIALAPIFLLWFGIGMEPKIALSFSLAYFVVFSNALAGVMSVDADRLLMARVLGASRWQTFQKIVFPGAVPSIFTGLELGFIYGTLATVAGEMLAGQSGLGVRLQQYASAFQIDRYFATIVILVVGTMIIAALLRVVRKRLLRWQEHEMGRAV